MQLSLLLLADHVSSQKMGKYAIFGMLAPSAKIDLKIENFSKTFFFTMGVLNQFMILYRDTKGVR